MLIRFIYILGILLIPLFIIPNTVCLVVDSYSLYKYGFNKYGISEITGINNDQLDTVAKKMIDYFDGKIQSPQLMVANNKGYFELYSDKELIHLEDVRKIIELFKTMQLVALLLLIILGIILYVRRGIYQVLKALQLGSIIILGIMAVLIAWSLIDFDSIFLLFHLVSFSNNLWILDPSKDYLIMMFPEGFFNDAAILIISAIIIQAVILCTPAFVLTKIQNARNKEMRHAR
ncbi:MAG: TIGR01906 family membrane protein [Chloroflexi bacterium]|nr:TIGR01906 family membrane protein [Chloroflexota bacterium]